MGNENEHGRAPSADNTNSDESGTRPQKGGEAATTRFGMEDGDNTDIPATGVDPDKRSPEKRAGSAGEITSGSLGAASGSQPFGTAAGGGSIETGSGSTRNAPTGNAPSDASD